MYKLIVKSSVKVLFLPFFFFMTSISIGQTENDPSKFAPNIIPPSPAAYKLGTYGNIPIGLFTGSQNINVPLYTYKTTNLEVPISMFYSSNGVRVDEVSSNVGQSWNLSFGGVITRVIRDKPDEERGQYPIPMSITEKMGRYSPPALDFYQYIGENDVDSEADLFSFNFGKYSGKFVFDNEGAVNLMPAQELQVECKLTTDGFNFIITTPDGVKYYFNDKEVTTQRIQGAGHSIPTITVSSWYLSKIVHPKGDEIQFTYEDAGSIYTASQSQTFRMLYPRTQYDMAGNLENYSPSLSSICDHTVNLAGKAIKSIKSTNPVYGEVFFTYLSASSADVTSGNRKIDQITIKNKAAVEIDRINFTYSTTTNKRVFLDKIQFKDPNQNYQFEYAAKESFPQRLSLSQDHWGYYNGKNNNNLVPKNIKTYELDDLDYNGADKELSEYHAQIGLLRKIIYPTKGYTTFDYESNNYYGEIKIYPNKVYKSLSAVTQDTLHSSTKKAIFTSAYTQKIPIVAGVSFNCLDPGLNAGKNQAYVSVYNNTAKKYVSLYRSDNNYILSDGNMYTIRPNTDPLAKSFYFNAELNQEYIITLTANFTCTSSSLNYNYLPTAPTTFPGNVITGGVRVRQTADYSINKPEPIIRRFHYARKNDLNKSTGNKGADPYYIDLFKVDKWLEPPTAGIFGVISTASYLNLSSSSLVSLFDTGNSNVYYNYVTISYGSDNFLNGGEEHEFIVHRDGGDGFVLGTYDIRNAPLTNLGWDNGLLKRVDYFNKNLKTVKETINLYEEKTALRREVISYSTRKNYEKLQSAPVNYTCTTADLTRSTPYRSCITNHKHEVLMNDLFGGSPYVCIAPGHNNVTIEIKHPCNGKTLPYVIPNLENIDNLSIVAYKSISFWYYLKTTSEIIYDINGLNPVSTVTNYNYKGINHTLLSSQSTNNSKQEAVETKYYYAKDAEMAGKPFINDLILGNILVPLDTQIFTGGTKLSEQLTIYDKSTATNNLLLPKSIYAAKFPNAFPTITIPPAGQLERKITFDQYDDKGNVVQYTQESGIPVSIIWGYSKTQPIAKIDNALYSTVSSSAANLQTQSDTGTEVNLLTALNTLLTGLPAGTMASTYTYLPLIGISTAADPRGYKITYSYDNYNRLKTVKDAEGKIISENQYHYKN